MRIWRSGGGFDLDIISEVLDAAHEAHGCAGLVITSKVVRSEVAKEGTVAFANSAYRGRSCPKWQRRRPLAAAA